MCEGKNHLIRFMHSYWKFNIEIGPRCKSHVIPNFVKIYFTNLVLSKETKNASHGSAFSVCLWNIWDSYYHRWITQYKPRQLILSSFFVTLLQSHHPHSRCDIVNNHKACPNNNCTLWMREEAIRQAGFTVHKPRGCEPLWQAWGIQYEGQPTYLNGIHLFLHR